MRKLSIIITFIAVILLVACSSEPDTYTVTFDTMGGSAVEAVTVNSDALDESVPEAPVKEGYRFSHWYETSELFAFDFSKSIFKDITLKAHFIETVALTFDSGDGSPVASLVIDKGTVLETVPTTTLAEFVFDYWYTDNENESYDFTAAIESDLDFTALWDLTVENKIALDIEYFEENMYISDNLLNTPAKGEYYKSAIKYTFDSPSISKSGVIISLPYGEEDYVEEISVSFKLDGVEVVKTYDISLTEKGDVVLVDVATYDFTDLSTEYDVPASQIDLYFEEDGSVPYIKITDFFELLDGFVDPALNITYVKTDTALTMSYQYYDEDEDINYDLELVVDSVENTFTTNDPGFYWAYVYSTETNYGRNIAYLTDHPDIYNSETGDVIYDLDLYNMDIVMEDGEVVVPYYVANQLFVGQSYYNIYFNSDELFGIYLLPDSGSKEYKTIHSSSLKGEDMPIDLVEHTFNMLAFDLDYLYGLKDVMGIDTYYDLLTEMKDDLLTSEANDLDQAISTLLLKEIDEPHTSYGYMSYYSDIEPSTSSLSDYGSRFSSWYLSGLDAVNEVIGARFGEATTGWNAVSGLKPDYWFLDDNTVMLTLNDFNTYDLYESMTYDETITADILSLDTVTFELPSIVGDYFYFYNSSTVDDDVLEILVKGVEATYVDTYTQALVAAGFTFVPGSTDADYKVDGYYTKDVTLASEEVVSMFVLVSYDDEYDLFYVGVAKEVPADVTRSWPVTADVNSLVIGDSAVYMEETLENIMEEHPTVTSVVLDLSWNTGGNVGALYRVLGYVTDQPFTVSGMNRTTASESTYVVSIEKSNPYTSLDWSLLTTAVTFSAANSMTKIFLENEIGPVIGVQTGGGACSITPILLPNGTAFTMSSNNISAIRTGSGTELDPYVFEPVEFGMVPDFIIDLDDIYSPSVLLGILSD